MTTIINYDHIHDNDEDNHGGDDVSFVVGYDSIVYQSDFRANPMKLAGALTTVTCVTSYHKRHILLLVSIQSYHMRHKAPAMHCENFLS